MKPRHFVGVLLLTILAALWLYLAAHNRLHAILPLALGGAVLTVCTAPKLTAEEVERFEDAEQAAAVSRG